MIEELDELTLSSEVLLLLYDCLEELPAETLLDLSLGVKGDRGGSLSAGPLSMLLIGLYTASSSLSPTTDPSALSMYYLWFVLNLVMAVLTFLARFRSIYSPNFPNFL
jgi:hypothetical protein